MSTIYDIAKAAGVSPSTVARALRGTGYCSPIKKELIINLAQSMKYSPTHSAKTLKSKRSNKILFCIPDIYNPFYFRMIKGASDVLDTRGYFPILCHTRGQIDLELKMIQNLSERYGDGMILVSFNFTEKNIAAVNQCGMPVVLTNKYESANPDDDQFDYVYIDTFEGIRLATSTLIDLGHRRIAYIGGNQHTQTGQERHNGYLAALLQAGIPQDPAIQMTGDYTTAGGARAARKLLRLTSSPTAIVCANDLMAFGVLKTCRDAGVNIPKEISLIGMDNTESASWSYPTLTSVAMKEEEIGHYAGEFLLERIYDDRKNKRSIRLLPDIVVRDSIARCRTN